VRGDGVGAAGAGVAAPADGDAPPRGDVPALRGIRVRRHGSAHARSLRAVAVAVGPPLRAAALPAAGQPGQVPGLHPRDGGPGPGVGRRTAVVVPVSEILVVAAISLAAASGVPGLFLPRRGRAGEWLAAAAIVAAGACGAVASVAVLLGGPAR